MADEDNIKINVIEEQLAVEKAIRTTGSLHVKKSVSEAQVPVVQTLASETFEIERVVKNEALTEAPKPVREEGDRIVISVVEERVVVEKRLFLVEEIHVVKKIRKEEYRDEVTLRKEVVDVVRKPASE